MKKIISLGVLAGFLLSAGSSLAEARKDPFPWLGRKPVHEPVYPEILVDCAWLEARLPDSSLVLIDARPSTSYEAGHIPGALPFRPDATWVAAAAQNRPQDLQDLLGARGLSGQEEIVLYGDALSYEDLGQLFWLLEWAGCRRPRVLNGGVAAWSLAGGVLSKDAAATAPRPFRGERTDSLRITADWINERYGKTQDCELIDLRDAGLWDRFDAASPYRPGHIPHSLPYDFRQLVPGDGAWPDPVQARNRFSLLGPRERDYVDLGAVFALYGEDPADFRPGLGYLLLTLMDVRARIFCGGWADWSADEELPRVRIIDASSLKSMIERGNPALADQTAPDFALFDLRGDTDHARRHLPGALSLPSHLLPDSLVTLLAQAWPAADRPSLPLVLYCYGPECTRSRIGATRAARLGFRQLFIFRGGIAEWQAAALPFYGHPVESHVPRLPPKKQADPRRG